MKIEILKTKSLGKITVRNQELEKARKEMIDGQKLVEIIVMT